MESRITVELHPNPVTSIRGRILFKNSKYGSPRFVYYSDHFVIRYSNFEEEGYCLIFKDEFFLLSEENQVCLWKR